MLQKEYERFVAVYEESVTMPDAITRQWQLSRYVKGLSNTFRRIPRLEIVESVPVEYQGFTIFDEKSLPIEVRPVIKISIYNAVPHDHRLRFAFLEKMKRLNALYDNALQHKKGDANRERMGFLDSILVRVIPLNALGRVLRKRAAHYEDQEFRRVAVVQGSVSKILDINDILPYSRRVFRGFKVSCPAYILDEV
jgi:hypothetical protein